MGYDSRAIANYFIDEAHTVNNPITPMKVQKLVYFAHGWCLAVKGYALIDEPVQAWAYGPVIPNVYQALKRYGNRNVSDYALAFRAKPSPGLFAPQVPVDEVTIRGLLDRVWNVYKGYSGIQLSNMTHLANTPWANIRDQFCGNIPPETLIPNPAIKAYFEGLIQSNHANS